MDVKSDGDVGNLALEFDQKLFYLCGYPHSPESALGNHEIDNPNAHGEELRRRYEAKIKMESALARLGAISTVSKEQGRSADFIVVPDDEYGEKQHQDPSFPACPVLNETMLLKYMYQGEDTAYTGAASSDIFGNKDEEKEKKDQRHNNASVQASTDAGIAAAAASNTVSTGIEHRRYGDAHQISVSNVTNLVAKTVAENATADMHHGLIGKGRRDNETDESSSSDPGSDDVGLELDADEHRERTEWHRMLSAALTGEVVISEKKRLNTQPDGYLLNLTDNEYAEHLSELLQSSDFKALFKHIHLDIWFGCRAVIRGRTPQQEKQTLESLRAIYADNTLRAVIDFNADRIIPSIADTDNDQISFQNEFSAQCLVQLQKLLRRLDYVECMYPTLKSLGEAKPLYASKEFQEKLSVITSWTNISVRLELLYKMIQRWTGSEDLSLFSTTNLASYESTTAGITDKQTEKQAGKQDKQQADTKKQPGQMAVASDTMHSTLHPDSARQHLSTGAPQKEFKHTPFVERLLKENGLKKIFEQKILTELEEVMLSARCDIIEKSGMISEIGLPATNRHMQELLRFPSRLLQTCLQIRLESAENLTNPAPAQLDQLIEDIGDSLSTACRVKRSFISLSRPNTRWNPGVQLDSQYDYILHSCLQTYFRLIQRKLMLSSENGLTKVFEVLENQWPFLQDIATDIEGGHLEMARRYCQQARLHMRMWTISLARMLKGPQKYDSMSSRELGKWLSRVLQVIRSPVLKCQRLVRTIQSAVANSTDYTFDDPFPLLAKLVDTKHVLVYTSGEWESRGVYIIGSQSLPQKPHMAKMLLSTCIVDDVIRADQNMNCYLLIVRTDAEFSWTGATIMPEMGEIAYQDLELSLGQMRLISPGLDLLERHRRWLEKINIADMLMPWETATSVTDELIANYIKNHQRSNRSSTSSDSNESIGRQISRSKRYAGSATSGSEKGNRSKGARVSGNLSVDDEPENFTDSDSDFTALRSDLSPLDHKLDRINNPAKSSAVRQGLIEDLSLDIAKGKDAKPAAPARICELTRAHNPQVQREWTLLKHSIVRMLDALTQIPDMLRTLHIDFHERAFYEAQCRRFTGGSSLSGGSDQQGSPSGRLNSIDSFGQGTYDSIACRGNICELLEQVQEAFLFVSNTAARGSRFLDLKAERYVRIALMHMSVGWCGFITEDCMANEKRTFRWAVLALESTMRVCKDNALQVLEHEDWLLLKAQVAGCLTIMISHFDILGARNEELKLKERQNEREKELRRMDDPNALLSLDGIGANVRTHLMQRQRAHHSQQVDIIRDQYLGEDGRIGRVLEVTARPEDQTLRMLAASKSNITIRWQLGRYIGGGAFGAVYTGYNLDTGEPMAVKEIRFPARPLERAAGKPNANQGAADAAKNNQDNFGMMIVREMEIMSMLQHDNIVTYYGIEVHREKVYLFMELCPNGSLTRLIKDQGRLDEETIKLYVVQILRGLRYLHEVGICHRDIKCDNTLLDENMNIKLVDFGAARVLNYQSQVAATRRTHAGKGGGGGASLAGTPMYMAPEVIAGSNSSTVSGSGGGSSSRHDFRPGKFGAQDVWSLGCCIVEMVTGNPPWAHLDNEWAIMYHVVSGDPSLPDSSEISAGCMRFLKRCLTRQPADRPQATELLQDEWLATTLRNMEQIEARQSANRHSAEQSEFTANNGYRYRQDSDAFQTDDASNLGATSNSVDAVSGLRSRDHVQTHSISSVGSTGSASNAANRSRASSISRKNISGDLRFMSTNTASSNADTVLSLIEHGSMGSSGDRSPSGIGAGVYGSLGGLKSSRAGTSVLPMARTPGSPNSASSLHTAWPFNKDSASGNASGNNLPMPMVSTPLQTAPPLLMSVKSAGSVESLSSSAQASFTPWNPLTSSNMDIITVTSNNMATNDISTLAPNETLRSAGEVLTAMYTSPSAIYQAISGVNSSSERIHAVSDISLAGPILPSSKLQNTIDMDSPIDSIPSAGKLTQFSIDSSNNFDSEGGAESASGDTGMPVEADSSKSEQASFPTETPSSAMSASVLSNDEIQDLTETTRKAVSAMLSMPLEGVDVAGVAGWLGEGNTPMELLDAEEIKETVATTSHIVARQREQQIRRQQELRHYLHRQKHQEDAPKDRFVESAATVITPAIEDMLLQKQGGVPRTPITEPPALFPLPPEQESSENEESSK
ncbi:Suppressor of Sensor Kinase (SLN1) [Coemansia spiralis]|uniref:Suppressor of Sensor Kinase (SLN1) n=2 Tax=Coemansia TaxID=4863 RepID=A0A9W8G3P8_9FUNG|nr:Suppressor of Sensor Kinase (SLN1) [Coemansia umbellata]KAJ2619140.1 Suppressor of Sensor Kinase (SLN1) [Coemansia sp. RSA 1358]KAJ2670063.1 Suppressor of Sensor Kinase (SLN1) [Coemansia spiralis]